MKRAESLKFINNLTLWEKLSIIMVTLFLSIIILGSNLTVRLNKSYNDNINRLIDTNLSQFRDSFIGKLNDYSSVIDILINNRSFTQYTEQNFDSDYEAYTLYRDTVAPFLESIGSIRNVDFIRFYSNNETLRVSGITNNLIQSLEKENWFDKKSLATSGFIWTIARLGDFSNDRDYICCYKLKYIDIKTSKYTVYTVFAEIDRINSILSEALKSNYSITVLDNNNQIFYATQKSLVGKGIKEYENSIGYERYLLSLQSNTVVNINNIKYIYKLESIDNDKLNIHDWRIMYMVPAGNIQSGSKRIWIYSITVCVMCFLISIALILLISRNITFRVRNVIEAMKKVQESNFDLNITVSGNDEIGTIEYNFNEMVMKINSLIKKAYEDELKIKDTEIKNQMIQKMMMEAEIVALQSQINPHYLYNTLETIRMDLVLRKQRELASIIKAFAEGFRMCVHSHTEICTLKEELQIIESFILIQKYRLGERLDFIVNIDEGLYNCRIPKLILQPLVENAVLHGIEPKQDKGMVEVSAHKEGESLILEVFDDGAGIEQVELEKLNNVIYENDAEIFKRQMGKYSALKNVNKRLKLHYGEEYGLTIESKINEFSRMVLILPFKTIEP